MKAIIYGRKETINKLSGILKKEGIEVESKLEANSGNREWQEEEKFDLAFIDSRIRELDTALRNIRKAGNPLVTIVVNPREANWDKLNPLNADCYLLETNKVSELTARLKAILRRSSHYLQAPEEAVEISGGITAG
jgi:DNA-binding response OmpR family regulator